MNKRQRLKKFKQITMAMNEMFGGRRDAFCNSKEYRLFWFDKFVYSQRNGFNAKSAVYPQPNPVTQH